MFTLRQYLLALLDSRGLTRTLGEIDVCRDEQGRPCFSAGNSAAVFRIRLGGRIRSLRCYLRPMRHLKEIYGQRLLEKCQRRPRDQSLHNRFWCHNHRYPGNP